jgi:hypothetical protein
MRSRGAAKVLAASLLALSAHGSPAQTPDEGQETLPAITYGDWMTVAQKDVTEAFTRNDADQSFGFACGSTCLYYVDLKTECEEAKPYEARVVAPQASFPATLTCMHLDQRPVFITPVQQVYFNLLSSCEEIIFTVTLAPEKTVTARFSLSGGWEAVYAAVELAIEMNEKAGRDSGAARSLLGGRPKPRPARTCAT